MIKNKKYNEIALMFELFSKVEDANNQLKKNLQKLIIDEGNKLINDT